MADKKQRSKQVLICPNPLATSTGGMDAGGDLMPPAIHGGVFQEADQKDVEFNDGLTEDEVKDMMENSPIENARFEKGQFEKYFGQEVSWCALNDPSNGDALAIACMNLNHPFKGYCYLAEIQGMKKGYGKSILVKLIETYKKVWLMANTAAGDTLIDYYRKLGMFEEIYIEDSVYGCPAYFFCTKDCDYGKLEDYCVAFYANDNGEEQFDESTIKKESSIDYPVSEGLCPEIWDEVETGKWIVKPEIKQQALEIVDILLARYHVEAKGVNIVGSICSNQYTEDGDVDVHIQVDMPEDTAEALNKLRKLEIDKVFEDVNLMVGASHTHPLEFYFQPNIYADMGSCGCYDLMNDEWLSGPLIVDMEFDPYDEYEESWQEAFEIGERAQSALFDLTKKLYKHNAILEQASNKDVYSNGQLMSLIGRRLEEVKDEILDSMNVIADLKDEMV